VGGSPFNVAVGLARLGRPVGFLGSVSSGFLGARILQTLQDEGVDLGAVTTVDGPTTLGMVGLDAAGAASYAFYGHGGADRQLRPRHLPAIREPVRALHVGSYSMVVEPVASALRHLVERERDTRVIAYDPNVRLNVEPNVARWVDTVDWMVQRAHLVKVSSEDLELLHPGRPLLKVVKDWLSCGVALVVVTHAGSGSVAFTARDTVGVRARPVNVVDTVGAGDTFHAALLCWLDEQDLLSPAALSRLDSGQIKQALDFATAAASITCTRKGADLPRRQDVSGMLQPG
jgi:fructokinase